jgi:hypothetical protein
LHVKYGKFSAAAAAKVAKKQRAQRDEHAVKQQAEAPQVDGSLAGKHIEHLVQLEVLEVDEETGEEEFKNSRQWLPAVVTKILGGTDIKLGAKGQKIKVKAGWCLLNYDDGESLRTRLLEGTFNNNAVGSLRLELNYAKDPAALEESSSDEEGTEDHEASDSSEKGGRAAVTRREMKRRRKRRELPKRTKATKFFIFPLGLDAF